MDLWFDRMTKEPSSWNFTVISKLSVVNERSKNGLEIIPFVSEPRTAFTVNSFASAGALPTAINVCPRNAAC